MTKIDPSNFSIAELLTGYRAILRELQSRGVLRTDNAPTGDYAEYLISAYVEGELAPNSEKTWDVRARNGRLLQVKARVAPATGRRGTRQLSTVRTWGFDLLAVVLFDDDYSVRQAALIPAEVAKDASTYVRHVNGFRIIATDELLAWPDVEDITESLRSTAARI